MDSNSHPVDSDDHPHPKFVDFIGICIAVLTLVFPLSTVFRYAPEAPTSISASPVSSTGPLQRKPSDLSSAELDYAKADHTRD